jgi:two-component system LytT family response regulator
MMAFRVLVVDDEPLARQVAIGLLRSDSEIGQIDECADGIQAQQAIARTKPDIVFLDIEMPGPTGLAVAAESRETVAPVVVFTTAFGHYALDAFDVAATDYVLKPYSDERFRQALARAKRRVRERRVGEMARELAADLPARAAAKAEDGRRASTPATTPDYLRRLSLRDRDRTVVLKIEEVVWFEAEDYYVRIHSTRGRHLIRASLTSLEARLDPRAFVRTHRTAIVNVEHVRESHDRDGLCLVLTDGSQVGVSRGRKGQVEALLAPRLR